MCVLCACASTHFGLCWDVMLFSGLVRGPGPHFVQPPKRPKFQDIHCSVSSPCYPCVGVSCYSLGSCVDLASTLFSPPQDPNSQTHIVHSVPLVLGYRYIFRARVWIWPPLCSVNVVVFVVAVPPVLNSYMARSTLQTAVPTAIKFARLAILCECEWWSLVVGGGRWWWW